MVLTDRGKQIFGTLTEQSKHVFGSLVEDGTLIFSASSTQSLVLTGIGLTAGIGTLTLAAGNVTVALTGIASGSALGTPSLVPGTAALSLTGRPSMQAIGTPGLIPGNVYLSLSGMQSNLAIGFPTLSPGGVTWQFGSVNPASAFGSVLLVPGAVTIQLSGAAGTNAFGVPRFELGDIVLMTGIASATAIGLITLEIREQTIGSQEVIHYPVQLDSGEYEIQITLEEFSADLGFSSWMLQTSIKEFVVEMEVLDMPLIGATVTLRAVFPGDAGDLATLTDVTVKIYDDVRKVIQTIDGENIVKVSNSEYEADYVVSDVRYPIGDLVYEFSGKIGPDGERVLLGRKPLGRKWLE